MKKILLATFLLASTICFSQDRSAQKRFEDSLMRITYQKMAENKKGSARYFKDLYDRTKNPAYLDSVKSVINIHRNKMDEAVNKRKHPIQ